MEPGAWLGEAEAKALLRDAGVAVPGGAVAADEDDAVRLAAALGGPVAIKASSPALQHKSEAGAVVLDVAGEDAVRAAYRAVRAAADAALGAADGAGPHGAGPADSAGAAILVEAMASPGVELVVAARRDAVVPALVVGLGGVWTELLGDVAVIPLPATPERVAAGLRSLRGAGLLTGARGRPPVDLDALARLAAGAGDLLLAEDLVLLELNPVIAGPGRRGRRRRGRPPLRPRDTTINRGADDVVERLAARVAGELLRREHEGAPVGVRRVARVVRRDREREVPERMAGRQRLGVGDVEHGAQPPALELGDERARVHDRPAAGVDAAARRRASPRARPRRAARGCASLSGARTTTASAAGSSAASSSTPWTPSRARDATPTTVTPNGRQPRLDGAADRAVADDQHRRALEVGDPLRPAGRGARVARAPRPSVRSRAARSSPCCAAEQRGDHPLGHRGVARAARVAERGPRRDAALDPVRAGRERLHDPRGAQPGQRLEHLGVVADDEELGLLVPGREHGHVDALRAPRRRPSGRPGR